MLSDPLSENLAIFSDSESYLYVPGRVHVSPVFVAEQLCGLSLLVRLVTHTPASARSLFGGHDIHRVRNHCLNATDASFARIPASWRRSPLALCVGLFDPRAARRRGGFRGVLLRQVVQHEHSDLGLRPDRIGCQCGDELSRDQRYHVQRHRVSDVGGGVRQVHRRLRVGKSAGAREDVGDDVDAWISSTYLSHMLPDRLGIRENLSPKASIDDFQVSRGECRMPSLREAWYKADPGAQLGLTSSCPLNL